MKIAYAAATVVAGLMLAAGANGHSTETDMLTTASIAPTSSPASASRSVRDNFKMLLSGADRDCRLTVGEAVAGTAKRPLRLAQSCFADNPGLASAQYWVEQPDGAVTLSGADGHVVARLATADGAAFESYYPTLPVMTLLPAE